MPEEKTLICRSCERPAAMLTELGFCARCYWTLERAVLSEHIGRAPTIRFETIRGRER